MKKIKLISLFLALCTTLTLAAGCNDGAAENKDDTVAPGETYPDTLLEDYGDTVEPEETEPPIFTHDPEPIVYPEFSGVVLSIDDEDFDTYDFTSIGDTQVTDVLIDGDKVSLAKLEELDGEELMIWITADFDEDRALVKENIDNIIAEYGVYIDGIEIDFTNVFDESSYNNADDGELYYAAYSSITEFMGDVHEAAAAANLRLSARVGADLNINADYGLDVPAWAARGYVERVSPTAGGNVTDTGMPVRLWASVLNTWNEENKPFVVELTPRIEKTFLPYPKSPKLTQNRETVIGMAALMLGQGADKVCIDASVAGEGVLSVIGAYNTAKAENRRLVFTVNPYASKWSNFIKFPLYAFRGNGVILRVPIGPIDDDSTAVLKFTAPTGRSLTAYPTVYVNSVLCEFVGVEPNPSPEIGGEVHCFKIPAAAYEMYAVAEVQVVYDVTIEYAEVAIEVAP